MEAMVTIASMVKPAKTTSGLEQATTWSTEIEELMLSVEKQETTS